MNATPSPLRPNTRVRLPDGTIAYASPDVAVGRPFDGTYRTTQRNPVTGGDRIDTGWRREQLEVVSPEMSAVRS